MKCDVTPGTSAHCNSFEPGPLLPSLPPGSVSTFDVLRVQVFGTSEIERGLEGLRLECERRGEAVRKARKVDRAAFLDDFRSGAIGSKAFSHVNQVDEGRVGDDVS